MVMQWISLTPPSSLRLGLLQIFRRRLLAPLLPDADETSHEVPELGGGVEQLLAARSL